jgi:D-beta-D-heptose 7-phosphate kinase/D-beta-D-heptose 1-phosphate adenosyltransferase
MNKPIQRIISQFDHKKVLVLGEAMLDVYLSGETHRICREAPVPIVDIEQTQFSPGGAANTAVNLAKLGADVDYVSVIGNDYESDLLKNCLLEHGVDVSNILSDGERQTITKQRITAGDHLLIRFDAGTKELIDEHAEAKIIALLRQRFHEVDAVIVSDYGYGIITPRVMQALRELQAEKATILAVDAKSLDKYKGVGMTVAKPNYDELLALLAVTEQIPQTERAEWLMERSAAVLAAIDAEYVAATLDKDGALLFRRNKKPFRTHSIPVENSKAAGAGDTYTSALTLALTAGASIEQAAQLAQEAALVILQKNGTAVCSQEELRHALHSTKVILEWQKLSKHIEQLREEGRRIVFTNGCFDILHSGHVSYLEQAKAQGDVLVVALNSDSSVKKLKGPTRPINSLEERAHVLAGLGAVDIVTSFSQQTPIKLLQHIKPDVFVKGGDYELEDLPEVPVIKTFGGLVKIMGFVQDRSTSNLIAKIKQYS